LFRRGKNRIIANKGGHEKLSSRDTHFPLPISSYRHIVDSGLRVLGIISARDPCHGGIRFLVSFIPRNRAMFCGKVRAYPACVMP